MHLHRLQLAHAVGPGDRLPLGGGLELRLADDDDGRRLNVQAHAAGDDLRHQHRPTLGSGELVDELLAARRRHVSCQRPHRDVAERDHHRVQHVPEVREHDHAAAIVAGLLRDVDEALHLRRPRTRHVRGAAHGHEVPLVDGLAVRGVVGAGGLDPVVDLDQLG